MVIFVETDKNNKIIGWATSSFSNTNQEVSIEENDPFFNDNPFHYKVEGGRIKKWITEEEIEAEEKEAEEEANKPSLEDQLAEMKEKLENATKKVAETEATLDSFLTDLLPNIFM